MPLDEFAFYFLRATCPQGELPADRRSTLQLTFSALTLVPPKCLSKLRPQRGFCQLKFIHRGSPLGSPNDVVRVLTPVSANTEFLVAAFSRWLCDSGLVTSSKTWSLVLWLGQYLQYSYANVQPGSTLEAGTAPLFASLTPLQNLAQR